MPPSSALSIVCCALLALSLGWRCLALKYMARLRALQRARPSVWLVQAQAPTEAVAQVVGVYASPALAAQALRDQLASGQARYAPEAYHITPCPVHQLHFWRPL